MGGHSISVSPHVLSFLLAPPEEYEQQDRTEPCHLS